MKHPALPHYLHVTLKELLDFDPFRELLDHLDIEEGSVERGVRVYMVTNHKTGRVYTYDPESNELRTAGIGNIKHD